MKRIVLALMMLISAASTYSQGEAANWYFGHRAGIQFNEDGSVTTLNDGRIRTFEGCATISDAFGNLLFYTDGITVFDRNQEIMENGRSLFGDSSSTQSAIIVPNPADEDLYYIFTVDTKVFEADPDFGLNYSVVDMSLNDGNGDVVEKNIRLLNDCSEKIAAVIKDCIDQSLWLLTLATPDGSPGLMNTFHAFEVSAAGVNPTAVKSTFNDLAVQDPRGYLKLSPDGTSLACANATSGLYIYDFDSNTGVVTNQQSIDIGGVNKAAYGVEFSPNSELLYIHASNDIQGETGHSSSLYQYDLTAPDISGSEVLIHMSNNYRAGLQLGPNGRIYRTIANSYTQGTPYLGAINNPNTRGIGADYVHRAIDLGGNNATQGLPPFVQSFFDKTAIIRNADGSTSSTLEVCDGDGFLLETDDIPGATYEWEKDGTPIPVASHFLQISDADETDSGRYSVEITTTDPLECPIIGEAFIRVNPIPEAIANSLVQCDVDAGASEDGISLFNLENSIAAPDLQYHFFESQADRISGDFIVNTSEYRNTVPFNQTIYFSVTSEFGCTGDGEFELEVLSNPFSTSSFYTLFSCDEDPLDLNLTGNFDLEAFAQEQYPNIDVDFYTSIEDVLHRTNSLPDQYTTASTRVYARLESDNLCLGVDQIDLEVLPGPLFELEESYLLCTDGAELAIQGPPGFDFYEWDRLSGGAGSDFPDQEVVNISEVGTYRLTAGYIYDYEGNSLRCDRSFEFVVEPSNKALIEEVIIDDFTSSNRVSVMVTGSGSYEYSLDGITYQDSELFDQVAPGFYTVYVRDKNGCGISTKEISVLGYPKFFTPNGDGINDVWRITGTSEQFQPDAFITIYDRFGKLLAQISPLEDGWNGMLQSNPLPASDYWFRVKLSDGREITGHFALKR